MNILKGKFKRICSKYDITATRPPINSDEKLILFPKNKTIELLTLSKGLETETTGLKPGLIGKARGWTKTPTRWILLVEWRKMGCTIHIDLIYGLDSWKVLNS